MTILGVIAQEPPATQPLPTFPLDVVFQSTWDGTNGGTNAIDESSIHAPLTFSGSLLSNAQHLFDAVCSLRCQTTTGWVRAPANALYNIGENNYDFTVETFIRIPAFLGFGGMQMVGVWGDDNTVATQQWRMIIDDQRIYFQARVAGVLVQYSATHNVLTDTWYFFAICRYLGQLRIFQGEPGGNTALIDSRRFVASFDTITQPLYIGGNPAGPPIVGSNAFYQNMRITRGAWYQNGDSFPVPSAKFGFGTLYPSLVVDADIFHIARIGQVLIPLIPADDVFHAPSVIRTPIFVNSTTTNGAAGVASGTVTLVGSRTTGNKLIAFIQTIGGGKTFAVGGGWTIIDQQQDANSSTAVAWRDVDGAEAAPTFTWAGTTTFHGRMYQVQGVAVGSGGIGTVLKAQGASANLIVNGGVGLTTTGVASSVFAVTLTSSNSQVIPLPAGYTAAGATFNDANGSDRASLQPLGLTGAVSSPVNLAITSAFWHGYMIELKV